jgi:microcystin-dependent protein
MINRIFAPAFAALFAALVIYGFVPPPQHAAAQFADQSTFAGTSTGSANAQAITIGNIGPGTGNIAGVPLRFIPGLTNNGPTTLSVSGLNPVNVLRRSSIGNVALSGQELLAGEMATAVYQPAGYYLLSDVDMTPIGKTIEYRGSAVPRGALVEDGSCVSQTTYAPLFSVIGTTYGTCSAGLFALPDSRGTGFVALDGQGVNGLAGRITTASCATPNAVGICGHETQTLTLPQLPTGITATGTFNTTVNLVQASAQVAAFSANSGTGFVGWAWQQAATVTVINPTASGTVTSNNTSGAAHPILPPASFGRRAIKT